MRAEYVARVRVRVRVRIGIVYDQHQSDGGSGSAIAMRDGEAQLKGAGMVETRPMRVHVG